MINNFENISPREEKNKDEQHTSTDNGEHTTTDNLTRRKFIKGAAAATALFVAGKSAYEILNIESEDEQPQKSEISTKPDTTTTEQDEERLRKALETIQTKHQQEIQESEEKAIGKTFEQQIIENKSIVLDNKTRAAVYNYWRERYHNEEQDYKQGLVGGLERMKPWSSQIKQIFKHYDIPEKYIYLAIAESHFKMDAVSNKAAVGPYQITKDTARRLDLKITDNFDGRRDPILSAELCAKHLKASYEQFGGKDENTSTTDKERNENAWRFALMDYNGGYTGKYLKHVLETEQNLSKEQINFQKDENGEMLIYELNAGDTLELVAKEYHTSVTLLRKMNDLHDDRDVRRLQIGQELIIPQKREITFEGFNAWLEKRINSELKESFADDRHKVLSGDTLDTIAKIYDTTAETIQRLNNIRDPKKIKKGQRLIVPNVTEKTKIKKALNLVDSYKENINYPDKFLAIKDIIQEQQLDQILQNAKQNYKERQLPEIPTIKLSAYKIKKGDTFSNIVQAYKARYPRYAHLDLSSMIMSQNKIADKSKIRAGSYIHLRVPKITPPTLENIAKKYGYDLETMQQLNPAVINPKKQLPQKVILRLPL
jgi:membrane-bound lytic murein transglycosylase D